MPKKQGTLKCFSFTEKTISQMQVLCDKLMLKNQTNLLEFLINEKYKKEILCKTRK